MFRRHPHRGLQSSGLNQPSTKPSLFFGASYGAPGLMQRAHHPTTEMKSAARLAAEAAFAPAVPTTQPLFDTDLPEITVLRAKRVAAPPDGTAPGPASLDDANISTEPQPPAPKVPRVFLFKPAAVEFSPTAFDLSMLRDAQPAEAGDVRGGGTAAFTPVRRAKRKQNKPPPVTLIFAASNFVTTSSGTEAARTSGVAAPAPKTQTPTPTPTQTQGDTPAQRSTDLSAALAELTPIFATIRSASCFTVADLHFAAQWQRLSRALDEIAVDIRAASGKSSGSATSSRV